MVPVKFGDEETQGRPFLFNQDEDGNFTSVEKAVTTCPKCGHGQEFHVMEGVVANVKCDNCGYGDEIYLEPTVPPLYSEEVVVENAESLQKEILSILNEEDSGEEPKISTNESTVTIDYNDEAESLKSSCPFVDPIELGTFVRDAI